METFDAEAESVITSSFQDLSFTSSTVSIGLCSSSSENSVSNSSNMSNGAAAASEAKENEKTSVIADPNEASFRSSCPSKPHKGNDFRWDAVQCVKGKDGDSGLGLGLGHFRLLKKLVWGYRECISG
ncbi:hypothetical protein OIU78_029644 [Salix suchowensis]|nr:hypothetical protein OIU78_029644 [Salix suchowensis]